MKNVLIRFFKRKICYGFRVLYLLEANRNRKLDLFVLPLWKNPLVRREMLETTDFSWNLKLYSP